MTTMTVDSFLNANDAVFICLSTYKPRDIVQCCCGVYRDDDASRSFDVVVQLPTVGIVKLPVYVHVDIPSVISVQSSATLVYTIHNRSDSLQDFDIVIESSDAFMFAGHRQVCLMPHCLYVVLIDTFSLLIFAVLKSLYSGA